MMHSCKCKTKLRGNIMENNDIFAPYIKEICELKTSDFKESTFIAIVNNCMNHNPAITQDTVARNLLEAFDSEIGFGKGSFPSFAHKDSTSEERINDVRELVCRKRNADTLYHFTPCLKTF